MNKWTMIVIYFIISACTNGSQVENKSVPLYPDAVILVHENGDNGYRNVIYGHGVMGDRDIKTIGADMNSFRLGIDNKESLSVQAVFIGSEDNTDVYKISRTEGINGLTPGDFIRYSGTRRVIASNRFFSVSVLDQNEAHQEWAARSAAAIP